MFEENHSISINKKMKMIDKSHNNKKDTDENNLNTLNRRNRRSRRLASTRGIKWHNSDLDVYHTNDDINFSGWIRLFAGPDYGDETNISSLLEIDLDTTVYDLVTLLCLPNELTIYKQIGGSESERLNENTTLLEEQNEFLKVLGFSDHTRRKRLGVDPDLCHLINFHLGPAVPLKHLSGFKTCGSVYVLKGLVFPQWKLRPMTILGPILFIFPGNVDGTPEEIDLRNAQIVVAENRNGRFVLQLSPSTGPCTNKSEVVHLPLRQIYLGFDRLWERNLWQSWLLRATSSSVITVIARNDRSTDHMNNELDKEEDNNITIKNNKEENDEECLKKKKDSIRIDLSGSALEQIPDSMWHSLITIATSIATEDDNDSSTIMSEIKHNNRIPSPPPLPMVITTINGSNNNSSSITLGSGKSTIPSSSTIIQTNSCNNNKNNQDILVNGVNTTTTKQVEEIDLAYNKLSEDVALQPLTLYVNNTLRSLRLTANSIRTFPTCLFECKLLMKLDLCDNQLNYVPKDLSKLENLEELKLDRNELVEIPEAVNLLPKLSNLQLAENKIHSLPEFMKMRTTVLTDYGDVGAELEVDKTKKTTLSKVNLRANQLKGCIILGNYGNLTHLDVSENKIENLDLSALDKLEVLHCSRNKLVELSLNGKSLSSIIAGNNELKKININPSPINLQHIDLSHNSLGHLPAWLSRCSNLRSLFASHNLLASLPEHLFSNEQSSLRTLQLGYNKLTSLPPLPRQLYIQELFLQHNSLGCLPDNFFIAFNQICVLNLSNNRLCQLPFMNIRCMSLEKLYLTANCLNDESLAMLRKCNNLKVLHAAYNCFNNLPESCVQNWSQIEELVLSGNSIQSIPDNITLLSNLTTLRLHSNNLQNCPMLAKLPSLKVLDLAHNQLDRINLDTLVPQQLQFLDLSCNSKLHVDSDQFHNYRTQRPMSLVDVSGQNRTSLPSTPKPFFEGGGDSILEPPWKVGFSETAGNKAKLYISQLRLPLFCNTEGLFGIFDGENNNSIPHVLEKTIPRILLEERTMKETAGEYMKYTMLSAHRELREKGQKHGVCATVVHISRTKATSETFIPSARRFVLRVASVGLAKVVLYRRTGAVCLTPTSPKRQLGYSSQFPLVVPDPEVAEINLDEDDEFIIIANKHIWEVISIETAAEEVRAQSNAILAAKRLQDLAQSYGAEENLSVIVVRFQLAGSGVDQLMRELRHTIRRNKHACEVVNCETDICQCSCCCDPQRIACVHCAQIPPSKRSSSGDRSSPSGQSDQASSELTVSSKSVQRLNNTNTILNRSNFEMAPRKLSSERRSYRGVAKAVRARVIEEKERPNSYNRDNQDQSDSGLPDEQYKCWEYMLEQNTQLLFDKELNTLSRGFKRNPRGRLSNISLSRSSPHLASDAGGCTGSIAPFLSKHFGSARSFNPLVTKSQTRIGTYLNGGPHAAYFGSLQRLMPYNLEYDFAVMQERGANLDSLDYDSRMQQYWGVATTEL